MRIFLFQHMGQKYKSTIHSFVCLRYIWFALRKIFFKKKKRTWWARKTSTLLASVNALVISSRLLSLFHPEWHPCFQSGLGPLSNLRLCFTGRGDLKEGSLEGLPQASPWQPLRKGCSSLIEQTGAKLPRKASPINATWHLSLRSGPACVCTSVLVKCCSRAKQLHVHVIKQNKAKPKPNNIPKWHVIFFLTKYVILLWRGWAGRGGRKGDKRGIQEPIHLLYIMYF